MTKSRTLLLLLDLSIYPTRRSLISTSVLSGNPMVLRELVLGPHDSPSVQKKSQVPGLGLSPMYSSNLGNHDAKYE